MLNQIIQDIQQRRRRMKHMADEIQALIEILGIEPVQVRPSCYQGVEIILSYEPYHCITMIGTGQTDVFCYSKREFPGSSWNGMGDWILSL